MNRISNINWYCDSFLLLTPEKWAFFFYVFRSLIWMYTHEHKFITFYMIMPSIQYEYHWHWFQYLSISFIRFFYVLYQVMIIIFIFWIIIDVNIHLNSTVAFTFIEFLEQSLDPYNKKLHTDTWYYAKRCFLALAENMSKHMLILKVSTYVRTVSILLDSHHINVGKPSNLIKLDLLHDVVTL